MQALWMLVASLVFASMAVCVKFASAHFNAAEMVFYRGVIGMGLVWLWARSRGESLGTHHVRMHAWRSLVGVSSLGAWFYALGMLPLATAMTLNYMSSVWVAAFLVGGSTLAWLRRPGSARPARQGALALTVVAGFVGVVMMLRPTIQQHQMLAGLAGLLSGVAAAGAYLQVTALSRLGEPESRTVFYFAVGSALAGGTAMLFMGMSPWHWPQALWLLPVGLLAAFGQLCMTRAYSRGATLVVANLQYSGIVFAAFYGLVLFDDPIPWIGWSGMAVIVGSGIAASVLRAPAQAHPAGR